MSIEELKKSVQDWKETVDANAFADSVGAFAESTVSASPIIDKASTWAAAGTATVAGLAITNIDKMISVYSAHEVKWLFSFLAISIFFALIQKYFAIACEASLKVVEELHSRFPRVLTVYEENEKQIDEISKKYDLGIKAQYDFSKVLESYINLFPKWSLLLLRSRFRKSIADRNYSHTKLVAMFVTQNGCAFIQYLAILVFVCLAATFV
ncbi:MAG: hypothetical protein AABZ84_01850 [Pseudomonadota bacterium]